ncbi:hypothetical protein BDR03DRAFT_987621 [Suillus americanus]|nr:hypothetical protein BDR03DRAFT_987621 [Suillus americanus]
MKEIDNPQPAIYGNWQELVHPLGGTYYHHITKHVIAWLEDMNGEILFGECIQPSEWGHKRLELEAQYWKHFEFFPHQFQMASWQMNQIGTHLAAIESLANNEIIEETGIVFCLRETHRSCKLLVFMSNAAAMMLCMPITIGRIRSTSIDGVLNGVEVNSFIDGFSSQAKSQIALARVSMAMDIAILAIPGLGTTETSQTLCSCSFLFGVGCIFAGMMVQHFGERMRSMDFVSYYLRQKMKMFIVITGIPTTFFVLRITGSVTGSILGFLSGVATDFKPSAPIMAATLIMLGVVMGSLLVLVLASYGPGPARVRPQ